MSKTHSHTGQTLFNALWLTLAFGVVEVLAGYWSGSLALLSDAGHMLTDSLALAIAACAHHVGEHSGQKPGEHRAERLAALANSLMMAGVVVWIVYEAIDRLAHAEPVKGGVVLVVAALGLAINGAVARMLHQHGSSLNVRAALLHVLGDMLGSVAALAAGLVILLTGWLPIDPILSLVVAGLIAVSTVRLLWETLSLR